MLRPLKTLNVSSQRLYWIQRSTVYGIGPKIEHIVHVICYFCEVLYLGSSMLGVSPSLVAFISAGAIVGMAGAMFLLTK